MNENERCPECGSWGEECAFPTAQAGCGCARCLSAELASKRQQAADLTKILMREGAHQTAYEWRLAEALRERDEARACLAFERVTVAELRAEIERFRNAVREKERLELAAVQELDEARAEVERLRLDNADLLARLDAAAFAVQHGIREVAERQREACAKAAQDDVRDDVVRAVRATPLVTEGDK